MIMTLHEMPVGSVEVLRTEWQRPDFSLHEMWRAVVDGELEEFEQAIAQKTSSAAGRALCDRILCCLAAIGAKQPPACPLLVDSIPTKSALAEALAPYDPLAELMPQNSITARAADVLQQLCGDFGWGPTHGWILYLFLLLHCQVKPQDEIRPQDVKALCEILCSLPSAAASAVRQSRLAIGAGGFLRCVERQVQQRKEGRWVCLYEAEAPLAGLCCLGADEHIVLRADGSLASCTPQRVRTAAAGRRIVQAAAWGDHYILLCDDGTAVSDLALPAWKELQSVQMGANCAAGIRGSVRRGTQWNNHPQIDDITDLVSLSVHTYDGARHYAALRAGGELRWDGVLQPVPGVTAAALCMQGLVYVQAGQLWLYPYRGDAAQLLCTLPESLVVEELHCRDDRILCGTAEKPFAVRISSNAVCGRPVG